MGFGDNFGGLNVPTATQSSEKKGAVKETSSWGMMDLAHAQAVIASIATAGGVSSGTDAFDIDQALKPLIGETNACLLSSWCSGSPRESTQSILDARPSAETRCKSDGFLGFGGTSVGDARKALKDVDPQLAQLVDQIGFAAEKKGTDKWLADSKEDSDKITDQIKQGAAIGGGVSLIALAIAAGVYLAISRKG